MTAAVEVRSGGRPDALASAAGLLASAVLTLLVPLVGPVRTADGSPVWFAPGALWVMVLPAAVAAALAVRRPVAALAVAAGAGLMGLARLLVDLSVLTAPTALARPDLFVETTDRALPLHAASGGFLLLAADLVALAAGGYAAMRLAGRLSFQRRSARDGDALTADDTSGDDGPGERPRRNNLMAVAGFAGVLLLAIDALTVRYQGGYLTGRYLSVGVPLVGMVGAVLLAVLAATAVLVAGSLPRTLAVALLGGVALGACLPDLVAIVAVTSAPVDLSGTVWLGLGGGVLLVAAGLLTRVRLLRPIGADPAPTPLDPSDLPPVPPVDSRVTAAAGVAGVLAGLLAAAAAGLPPLSAGGLEDLLMLTDGSPVPGPTLFAAAAGPLIVAGVVALVPATARAGRAALLVLWAAAVPGVTLALAVLGDEGLSTARMLGLVWIGPGTWCGIAALTLAVLAALLAGVASRRVAEADTTVPDDESVAAARRVSVPVAAVLGVLTVVACCLPVYGTDGQLQGPTILRGYAVEAWGVWALLLVTVAAVGVAAVTRHGSIAFTLGAAAAVGQAIRLVVPAAVPDSPGFGLHPGAVVQMVLVLALLGGAVVLAVQAGRIRDGASWEPAAPSAGARRREHR